ncbi:alpha/beta hydrolase [Streptococcus macacae]|uniref:X-Pro dipeptidyl-peptidase (S15 family) n=1 Tax=Streptococcus macacae NCTC 11558 TaxID=764298 RepID=G5JXU6_9STRE|nr:alpha/beta hydrolase [Streptococcus macacae]EHJ51665.1 X-Pro dipeptidyl-peptidase (S15 family) [Streptococcus macacae NCTC 11558]SUN77653.1 X-Pro dipeptidyl-peptidase [Streptococcus macacae NCTC 11558]
MGHPAGGVKEQTAGLHAERLAKYGYVTIAFDASYQGESDGEPHHMEDPDSRVEDFRTTVDYLTTLPYVDNDRIGVLGICASGGYSFKAAATDKRIKALATISGADIGLIFRRGWTGDQSLADTAFPLLETIAQVRTAEANGAEITYSTWVANELRDDMTEEAKQGHLYYRTPRAGHPRSTNQVPLVNFDRILGFSAFNLTDLITQPVLFIAGSKALTLWESQETFDALNRDDKELFLVEGANHFDMYDLEPYVTQSVEKMAEFFGKHL